MNFFKLLFIEAIKNLSKPFMGLIVQPYKKLLYFVARLFKKILFWLFVCNKFKIYIMFSNVWWYASGYCNILYMGRFGIKTCVMMKKMRIFFNLNKNLSKIENIYFVLKSNFQNKISIWHKMLNLKRYYDSLWVV